jgi:hypothetical protein
MILAIHRSWAAGIFISTAKVSSNLLLSCRALGAPNWYRPETISLGHEGRETPTRPGGTRQTRALELPLSCRKHLSASVRSERPRQGAG